MTAAPAIIGGETYKVHYDLPDVQVEADGENVESLYDESELIAELERNNIKFTKEDIVFITKDKTGQTVWLEKGNPSAGLEHILNGDGQTSGHVGDFERSLGVSKDEIPDYLKKVISNGKVVSNKIKNNGFRDGYERVYYYEGNYYILTGIGTNGFVITAYPVNEY